MPIETLASPAPRRIAAAAPAFAAALALGLILAPLDLAAQRQAKSDKDFAEEIEEYMAEQGSRGRADFSPRARTSYSKDGAIAPQARTRPLVPSGPSRYQSFEAENKSRALRALDDAIQLEALRERRLP